MATDFIPYSDHTFRSWLRQFSSALSAAPADFGLAVDEAQKIAKLAVTWEQALDGNLKAQAAARAATGLKMEARAVAERAVRAAVKRVQAWGGVTDKQRAALGITLPAARSAAVPTEISTWPVGVLDVSKPLVHTIVFRDSTIGRKRPAGVVGCELWSLKESRDDKPNADDFKLAGVSLNFRHRMEFDKRVVGERMLYQMRWAMRKGIRGPFGPPVSGVVVG